MLGQSNEMRQFLHLVVHQGDVRRIHGDVAAYAAHGYAHLGSFQGRGIVDAITNHTHRLACSLILFDCL